MNLLDPNYPKITFIVPRSISKYRAITSRPWHCILHILICSCITISCYTRCLCFNIGVSDFETGPTHNCELIANREPIF
ncbi:hypothetical protein L6452_27503 [Arctium lappa]|uniref:Uncharacterized protein n=1 Tax=Arctium lappa TaxID=4217 RepID=A0ACB8ZVV9_ARCLA|nr:hypothetical protein L6452_27503 [Arctium lappa]